MKKIGLILVLVASILTTFSCKSDDDSSSVDTLIGTWKITQEFENDVELELGCDANSTFEFRADFTFVVNDYDENLSQNCVLDETIQGVWLKLTDNQYSFTNEDNDTSTVEIVFDGNDQFSITEIDGSFTYVTIYQRQ